MKELLEICAVLKTLNGEPCALATIVKVTGSAYRCPGARMLILPNGETWGMISGGCLDHDVVSQAQRVTATGKSLMVRYDSTSNDEVVFGTGLGCNGVVDVFIEPVTESFRSAFVHAVESVQKSRQCGAIATVVSTEGSMKGQHGYLTANGWSAKDTLQTILETHVSEVPQTGLFTVTNILSESKIFVQTLLPPVQLIIFGGWLDVVPLLRMAREIGFQTTVVNSHQTTAARQMFQEADAVLASPSDALAKIHCDERTVAVLMNHHFERDQEALMALTEVALPFIGLLGPAKRRQRLLEAIRNEGVSLNEEFENTLHGPAGLDIGAKTPEEIALSIMAEILGVLSGRDAKPIRDRLTPLHVIEPAGLVYV